MQCLFSEGSNLSVVLWNRLGRFAYFFVLELFHFVWTWKSHKGIFNLNSALANFEFPSFASTNSNAITTQWQVLARIMKSFVCNIYSCTVIFPISFCLWMAAGWVEFFRGRIVDVAELNFRPLSLLRSLCLLFWLLAGLLLNIFFIFLRVVRLWKQKANKKMHKNWKLFVERAMDEKL